MNGICTSSQMEHNRRTETFSPEIKEWSVKVGISWKLSVKSSTGLCPILSRLITRKSQWISSYILSSTTSRVRSLTSETRTERCRGLRIAQTEPSRLKRRMSAISNTSSKSTTWSTFLIIGTTESPRSASSQVSSGSSKRDQTTWARPSRWWESLREQSCFRIRSTKPTSGLCSLTPTLSRVSSSCLSRSTWTKPLRRQQTHSVSSCTLCQSVLPCLSFWISWSTRSRIESSRTWRSMVFGCTLIGMSHMR